MEEEEEKKNANAVELGAIRRTPASARRISETQMIKDEETEDERPPRAAETFPRRASDLSTVGGPNAAAAHRKGPQRLPLLPVQILQPHMQPVNSQQSLC